MKWNSAGGATNTTTTNSGDYVSDGDLHHFSFSETRTSDGYSAIYIDTDTKTGATWVHSDAVSGGTETESTSAI